MSESSFRFQVQLLALSFRENEDSTLQFIKPSLVFFPQILISLHPPFIAHIFYFSFLPYPFPILRLCFHTTLSFIYFIPSSTCIFVLFITETVLDRKRTGSEVQTAVAITEFSFFLLNPDCTRVTKIFRSAFPCLCLNIH